MDGGREHRHYAREREKHIRNGALCWNFMELGNFSFPSLDFHVVVVCFSKRSGGNVIQVFLSQFLLLQPLARSTPHTNNDQRLKKEKAKRWATYSIPGSA